MAYGHFSDIGLDRRQKARLLRGHCPLTLPAAPWGAHAGDAWHATNMRPFSTRTLKVRKGS
jgi:hypothetical protein